MTGIGIDVIKTWFTYITALIVVAGGFLFLYSTRSDAAASQSQLVIAGFVGLALQFVFGQQIASATAHQTSVAANTLSGSGPTTTVNTDGPVTTGGPTTVQAPPAP